MTTAVQSALPAAWQRILARHADPSQVQAFLNDARRYLGLGSPERVAEGLETLTLKNLLFAYVEPSAREDVLYELAVASLASTPAPSMAATGALGLGGLAIAALALARFKR